MPGRAGYGSEGAVDGGGGGALCPGGATAAAHGRAYSQSRMWRGRDGGQSRQGGRWVRLRAEEEQLVAEEAGRGAAEAGRGAAEGRAATSEVPAALAYALLSTVEAALRTVEKRLSAAEAALVGVKGRVGPRPVRHSSFVMVHSLLFLMSADRNSHTLLL